MRLGDHLAAFGGSLPLAGERAAAKAMLGPFRISDWWIFKLPPVLALFYAFALGHDAPILPLARQALTLLAAVAACAAFVGVLNDICDVDDDIVAGKPNRLRDKSALAKAAYLAVPALCGAAVFVVWRHQPALMAAYAGSWITFLLYSVPPFRLKARGLVGALADACGAHMFPALLAVLTASQATGERPDRVVIAATFCWSLCAGLRGIAWHQLGDLAADRAAEVRTMALSLPAAAVVRFGERILFPVELCVLVLLLAHIGAWLAAALLAFHFLTLPWHLEEIGIKPVIVAPAGKGVIVLLDYYSFWLPIALLLQSAIGHRADMLAAAGHCLLFSGAAAMAIERVLYLERQRLRQILR